MSARTSRRTIHAFLALLVFPCVLAAQEPERWVEVRSPNFTVVSDSGENQARRVLSDFERFRSAIRAALPQLRVDSTKPVIIIGVKEGETLQRLLPGFRGGPERVRPSGIFVPGDERNYAAVQLTATGRDVTHNLYHEYVHLLNRLNFRSLPVWLNEGLAEVYANTAIYGDNTEIGRADTNHLQLLNSQPMLEFQRLLAADHTSPEYNETDRASVFYAQSWLLTHYLLFGKDGANRQKLDEILDRLGRGADPSEASAAVLAEIPDLETELRAYSRQTIFQTRVVPTERVVAEREFPARQLPPAEVKALHGDFFLQTHRPVEARAALEESLRLDPQSTGTQESMGRLALLEDRPKEALEWFSRAVAGDSQSYLAHYCYALLTAEKAKEPDNIEEAEDHLERTIELNPSFAPAYAALSGFYMLRPGMMNGALELAQKAVDLDPDSLDYELNYGRILLRLRRTGEAIALGERVLPRAVTERERNEVTAFLESARAYEKELAEWQHAYAAARAEAEERRKRRAEAQQAAVEPADAQKEEPPEPKWGAGPKRRVWGSGVEGWISSVSCRGKTLDLQVEVAGYRLALHSSNYYEVGFNAAGWAPPSDFSPCTHLKGKRAIIIYTALKGKRYAGEILSIEIRP
jgi:tetratricopeptide (TPR) repeat protein